MECVIQESLDYYRKKKKTSGHFMLKPARVSAKRWSVNKQIFVEVKKKVNI
jgi:hypothetical protein